MKKSVFKFMIFSAVSFCFVSSVAYAQSFFNVGSKNNESAQPSAQTATKTNPVMSPEDFRNGVNSLGQQNLNNLSQQVNQQMKKSAPPKTDMNQPSSSNQTTNPGTIPPANPPSNGPASESISSSNNNNNATLPSLSPTSSAKPNPTLSSTPLNTQAPPTQKQVYTGFNFGNTNKPGTGTVKNSSTSNSGGWNIKY